MVNYESEPMIKRVLAVGTVLITVFWGYTQLCLAAEINKGPAVMILQTTKDIVFAPKPANFPHAVHQEAYKCGECHHTIKDGKQIPYVEGMPILKCEECHFAGSGMLSKIDDGKGIVKLDTFKDAAHVLCRECHNKEKSQNPELKEQWKGFLLCHGVELNKRHK